MKKLCVWLLCACLLLSLGMVGVSASDPISLTNAEQVGDTWVVSWNDAGATLVKLDVAGLELTDIEQDEAGGAATVSIETVPFGTHTVTYYFEYADDPGQYEEVGPIVDGFSRLGDASVTLLPTLDGQKLTIKASDSAGYPVAGLSLSLTYDGTVGLLVGTTDTYGEATFNLPPYNRKNIPVSVNSAELTRDGITYVAAVVALIANEDIPTTTTTTQPNEGDEGDEGDGTTTTTTESSESTTTTTGTLPTLPSGDAPTTTAPNTESTFGTVQGNTSTSMSADTVLMNVVSDTNLLALFGGGIDTFNGKARVSVSESDYARLIGTYGGVALGAYYTSPLTVSAQAIREECAKSGAFSDATDLPMNYMTFQLALQFLSADGDILVTETSTLDGVLYTVELPIPKSLQNCTVFGVAMTGDGVLAAPTRVTAAGGTVKFTVPVLGHFTLIGFEGETDIVEGDDTSSPILALFIVLIVIGVLLLIATGVLIYLFFIRKPVAAAAPAAEPRRAVSLEQRGGQTEILTLDDDGELDSGEPLLPPETSDGKRIIAPKRDDD